MISLTSSVVCTGKSCRYNDVINTSLSFWLEVILVIIMFIGLPQLYRPVVCGSYIILLKWEFL